MSRTPMATWETLWIVMQPSIFRPLAPRRAAPWPSCQDAQSMTSEPVPWSLSIGDDVLVDLFERVRRTRWTDSVDGSGWTHGADIEYLRQLSSYWLDGFDW